MRGKKWYPEIRSAGGFLVHVPIKHIVEIQALRVFYPLLKSPYFLWTHLAQPAAVLLRGRKAICSGGLDPTCMVKLLS